MPSLIHKFLQAWRTCLASQHSPTAAAGTLRRTADNGPLASRKDQVDRRGLFIIGAARTGTTILQNALNDANFIYLFGEPCFHHDPGTEDFAARYNAAHRSWGNQENKSSYCPRLFDTDASWQRYLQRLADFYSYVGSKIVINPEHATDEARLIFDFHCRHFYRSHYIFTFRNPLDVLMSTRGLAELNGNDAITHVGVLKGYFAVVELFIRALRNLPHVQVVFHEAVQPEIFLSLGKWLGVTLDGAFSYYDHAKVRHYALDAIPDAHKAITAEAMKLYEEFRQAATEGFALVQIEQNSGHFDQHHFTALGGLSKRIARFIHDIQ